MPGQAERARGQELDNVTFTEVIDMPRWDLPPGVTRLPVFSFDAAKLVW